MSRPPQLRPPGHPSGASRVPGSARASREPGFRAPRSAPGLSWPPRRWAVAGALFVGLPVVTAISWAQEAPAPAASTPAAISVIPEQVVTARNITPFGVSREGSAATVWAVGKTRAPSAEGSGPPRPSTPDLSTTPTTPTRPNGSAGSSSVDAEGEREGRSGTRASFAPLFAGRPSTLLAPSAPGGVSAAAGPSVAGAAASGSTASRTAGGSSTTGGSTAASSSSTAPRASSGNAKRSGSPLAQASGSGSWSTDRGSAADELFGEGASSQAIQRPTGALAATLARRRVSGQDRAVRQADDPAASAPESSLLLAGTMRGDAAPTAWERAAAPLAADGRELIGQEWRPAGGDAPLHAGEATAEGAAAVAVELGLRDAPTAVPTFLARRAGDARFRALPAPDPAVLAPATELFDAKARTARVPFAVVDLPKAAGVDPSASPTPVATATPEPTPVGTPGTTPSTPAPSTAATTPAGIPAPKAETGVLLAPPGGDGVLAWTGREWTEEPYLDLAGDRPAAGRTPVALAATATGDGVVLLRNSDTASPDRFRLYRRLADRSAWREIALPEGSLLRGPLPSGVTAIEPTAAPGDPLTVTTGHWWVDLTVTKSDGTKVSATVHLRPGVEGGTTPPATPAPATPVPTPSPEPTPTATPDPAATPTPGATATPTPVATPTPTATPDPAATPTQAPTPAPEETLEPTTPVSTTPGPFLSAVPTGTWCQPAVATCSRPLGGLFPESRGYRSQAFPGSGYGGRIITSPVIPEATGTVAVRDASASGGYLGLSGASFGLRDGAGDPATGLGGTESAAFEAEDSGWIGARRAPGHVARYATQDRQKATVSDDTTFGNSGYEAIQDVAVSPDGTSALALTAGGAMLLKQGTEPWAYTDGLRSNQPTLEGQILPSARAIAWPLADFIVVVGTEGMMLGGQVPPTFTGISGPQPATAAPESVGAAAGMDLLDVAFRTTDANESPTGWAVGRDGAVIRCVDDCERYELPADIKTADLRRVVFSGSQAIIASSAGVVVSTPDNELVLDRELAAMMQADGRPPGVRTVAGLPDGSAVVDGRYARLSADGPWLRLPSPLEGDAIALAMTRDPSRSGLDSLRVVASVADAVPDRRGPLPDPQVFPIREKDGKIVLQESQTLIEVSPRIDDGRLSQLQDGVWVDRARVPLEQSARKDLAVLPLPIRAIDMPTTVGGRAGWAVGGWGTNDQSTRARMPIGFAGPVVGNAFGTAAAGTAATIPSAGDDEVDTRLEPTARAKVGPLRSRSTGGLSGTLGSDAAGDENASGQRRSETTTPARRSKTTPLAGRSQVPATRAQESGDEEPTPAPTPSPSPVPTEETTPPQSEGPPEIGPRDDDLPGDTSRVRIVIGGHPACFAECAGRGAQRVAPTETLRQALGAAQRIRRGRGGSPPVSAVVIGGGRAATNGTPLSALGAKSYSAMLGGAGGADAAPVFPVIGSGDAASDQGRQNFVDQVAPADPATPDESVAPASGPPEAKDVVAYWFEVTGEAGTVRVIVIDNPGGALRGGVAGPQAAWLKSALGVAQLQRKVTVVIGSSRLDDRSLYPAEARNAQLSLFAAGGASAYVSTDGVDDVSAVDQFGPRVRDTTVSTPSGPIKVVHSGALGHFFPNPALYDEVYETDAAAQEESQQRYRDLLYQPALIALDITPTALDEDKGLVVPEEGSPVSPDTSVSATLIPVFRDLADAGTTYVERSYAQPLFIGSVIDAANGFQWVDPEHTSFGLQDAAGMTTGSATPDQCRLFAPAGQCGDVLPSDMRFETADPSIAVFVRAKATRQTKTSARDERYQTPEIVLDAKNNPIVDSKSTILCPIKAGTTSFTVSTAGVTRSYALRVVEPQNRGGNTSGSNPNPGATGTKAPCGFSYIRGGDNPKSSPEKPVPAPGIPVAPQPIAKPNPPATPPERPQPILPILRQPSPLTLAAPPLFTYIPPGADTARPPLAPNPKPITAPAPPAPPSGLSTQQVPAPQIQNVTVAVRQEERQTEVAREGADHQATIYRASPRPDATTILAGGAIALLIATGGHIAGRRRRMARAARAWLR